MRVQSQRERWWRRQDVVKRELIAGGMTAQEAYTEAIRRVGIERKAEAERRSAELTAKLEREAVLRKTCQICARPILAETGHIAHHGYQRPKDWGCQTASCVGARMLPYETDRNVLGRYLENMRKLLADMILHCGNLRFEKAPVVIFYNERAFDERSKLLSVSVTRDNFAQEREKHFQVFQRRSLHSFDDLLERELSEQERRIAALRSHIDEQQKRYDNWKQTHVWKNKQWHTL